MNKRKIINDPIYGFISIPNELVFDIYGPPILSEAASNQTIRPDRAWYIPGANHTRFHHAIGAMHLMRNTLDALRSKGHFIYDSEYEAALIAILLHDIGHGPFSHTLESAILKDVQHEQMSVVIINYFNQHFDGKLDFALQVFQNKYPRKFLNH